MKLHRLSLQGKWDEMRDTVTVDDILELAQTSTYDELPTFMAEHREYATRTGLGMPRETPAQEGALPGCAEAHPGAGESRRAAGGLSCDVRHGRGLKANGRTSRSTWTSRPRRKSVCASSSSVGVSCVAPSTTIRCEFGEIRASRLRRSRSVFARPASPRRIASAHRSTPAFGNRRPDRRRRVARLRTERAG